MSAWRQLHTWLAARSLGPLGVQPSAFIGPTRPDDRTRASRLRRLRASAVRASESLLWPLHEATA